MKRAAPLLIPGSVGFSVAGSAVVGMAALIKGDLELTALTQEINQDLEHLGSTMNQLQVDSLAEMVLQNRRGLDFPFMSQGPLCVALGENCCFYANKSGIIKNLLAKVRENIQHINEMLNKKSWFQGRFEWNPWLTTLLTGLVGALILQLLGLLIGPCVLRWLNSTSP